MPPDDFVRIARRCPASAPALREALDYQSAMAHFPEAPAAPQLLLSALTICVLEASNSLTESAAQPTALT